MGEIEVRKVCGELKRKGIPFFVRGKFLGIVSWRLYAFHAFLSKKIRFRGLIHFLFLPTSRRYLEITTINKLIQEDIEEYFKAKDFYKRGFIKLFDFDFYPSPDSCSGWLQLFVHVQEILITDQYAIKEYLKDGSVVLDIGANIGVFAVAASRINKNGKTFAFEPAERTLEVLRKNVAPYNNITVVPYAADSITGEKSLYVPGEEFASATLDSGFLGKRYDNSNIREEKVQTMTVDDFVGQNKLDKVDFIKIDAEGSESEIIKGATSTISRFRPIIVISAYHRPEDKEKLPSLIKSIEASYSVRILRRSEEDFLFVPSRV